MIDAITFETLSYSRPCIRINVCIRVRILVEGVLVSINFGVRKLFRSSIVGSSVWWVLDKRVSVWLVKL